MNIENTISSKKMKLSTSPTMQSFSPKSPMQKVMTWIVVIILLGLIAWAIYAIQQKVAFNKYYEGQKQQQVQAFLNDLKNADSAPLTEEQVETALEQMKSNSGEAQAPTDEQTKQFLKELQDRQQYDKQTAHKEFKNQN